VYVCVKSVYLQSVCWCVYKVRERVEGVCAGCMLVCVCRYVCGGECVCLWRL